MSSAMTDGFYKLLRPVPNPRPTRRMRRDWTRAATFEPGAYYVSNGALRRYHSADQLRPGQFGYAELAAALSPDESAMGIVGG